MQFRAFELFEKEITDTPEKNILNALDLNNKILEKDLSSQRRAFTDEEYSILCFRQFIRAAKLGEAIHGVRCLPPDHIELYKRTIVRLVQASELELSAMERFDGGFIAEAYF